MSEVEQLSQEVSALREKMVPELLREIYEWGYVGGQNNPNGYIDEQDRDLGWETLKADIYAAAAWGAKVVFIDPITNLTNGMAAADANVKLQEIAQEISAMALDLNIVVFLFAHLKAPEGNLSLDQRQKKYKDGKFYGLGNCPHELGGDVVSSQFAGSRAMMRSCNLMLGLEGNKDPELPEHVRNLRNLRLLEDREFGGTGNYPLFWNKETTMFEEV
ncbi:hypothetical protein FBPa8_0031 [Pseudomonas phage vB_PaeP_FBPa8]|nr:hypothetical protein FBPa8_0031 [Pseudomonas phage vB_PaeP_FBPa8]